MAIRAYNRKYNNVAAISGTRWFRNQWRPAADCGMYLRWGWNPHRRDCTRNDAFTPRQMRRTTRIVVVCGGAALLGTVRGGGWWGMGMGIGGGACMWAELFNRLWKR